MPKHLTRAELTAGLPEILAPPADNGTLRAIVIRPEKNERRNLDSKRRAEPVPLPCQPVARQRIKIRPA